MPEIHFPLCKRTFRSSGRATPREPSSRRRRERVYGALTQFAFLKLAVFFFVFLSHGCLDFLALGEGPPGTLAGSAASRGRYYASNYSRLGTVIAFCRQLVRPRRKRKIHGICLPVCGGGRREEFWPLPGERAPLVFSYLAQMPRAGGFIAIFCVLDVFVNQALRKKCQCGAAAFPLFGLVPYPAM